MKSLYVATCLVLTFLFNAAAAVALSPSEVESWQEDINFYRVELEKKHINLFHTVSKEQFDAEIKQLLDKLPVLENRQQVVVEMMRITRLIGDGHTQFPIMQGPHEHFPIKYRLFGDTVRVVAAPNVYAEQLGKKLVAIDGVSIAKILETTAPVVQPVENEYGLMHSQAFHLTVADMLYGLGITKSPDNAVFTFESDDGVKADITVEAVNMHSFSKLSNQQKIELDNIFSKRELEASDGLWLGLDRATNTAYVNFSYYPSMDDVEDFAQDVRRFLNKNNVENLIIDLRENGGGDFYKGLRLSSPILMTDSINWRDGVYVLTGRTTFSAAMSNAAQFRSILNAKIVGEPTGGNPYGYSELGTFKLPNSKRTIYYSERFYRFENVDTQGVLPDVYVEMSEADYLTGKDSVLNWVLADIRSR